MKNKKIMNPSQRIETLVRAFRDIRMGAPGKGEVSIKIVEAMSILDELETLQKQIVFIEHDFYKRGRQSMLDQNKEKEYIDMVEQV